MELPWVKRRREKEKDKKIADIRKYNTDEENRLLDEAMERLEIAKARKVDHNNRFLNDKWREFDAVYRGDHWKGDFPSYMSKPVVQFIFSLIESAKSRLTDNTPEIIVMPRRDEKDKELADMLQNGNRYLWYHNRMPKKIKESVLQVLKYGTSILKAYWNPDDLHGIGEVNYSVIHPANFFPDPRAYTIQDMEYCLVSVPRSIESFGRRWRDKGHLVVPDYEWADTEQSRGSGFPTEEETATLNEYWFRDEYGNVCVMYFANNVVLDVIGGTNDKLAPGEPVYKHNAFPFVKFCDYDVDKEFWGLGEIEIVLLLQRLINMFEAQVIDNTRLMANAQWVVSKLQSGLREEDAWLFGPRPGNVIWTRDGGVERLQGESIPQHILQHIEWLAFAMERVLGIHDVVQGRRPVGVRAASAIIALQESANVRIRDKAANLEAALADLADQANWLMLEFYNEKRRVRVGGGAPAVTLNVHEALRRRLVDTAKMAELIPPDVTPEMITPDMLNQIMQEVRYPEFDVVVKVGPGVPYSAALLYEQAKEFYQLGIIDRQAVLEATNFPNREAILARMEGRAIIGDEERVGEITYRSAPGAGFAG